MQLKLLRVFVMGINWGMPAGGEITAKINKANIKLILRGLYTLTLIDYLPTYV